MFDSFIADSLIWLPEKGLGFYPAKGAVYGQAYFNKYRGYAKTERGREITRARVEFVARHYCGPLVDVGVGCGQFVRERRQTDGFDINPVAIHWLIANGRWRDIYDGKRCAAATFWDSLEHIEDAAGVVNRAARWVFLSLPIFRDCDHVLESRHYRKDEHFWYFTDQGLVRWFEEQGFRLTERNTMEQPLGREDIASYAFRRVHDA